MVKPKAATRRPARRRVAWVALLALLLNLTLPGQALRAMPPADLFASVICHAAGAPQQQEDGQGQESPCQGTCPFCLVLAEEALPALATEAVVLPRPSMLASASPRGPPGAAALPAQIRPPAARGPPRLT